MIGEYLAGEHYLEDVAAAHIIVIQEVTFRKYLLIPFREVALFGNIDAYQSSTFNLLFRLGFFPGLFTTLLCLLARFRLGLLGFLIGLLTAFLQYALRLILDGLVLDVLGELGNRWLASGRLALILIFLSHGSFGTWRRTDDGRVNRATSEVVYELQK